MARLYLWADSDTNTKSKTMTGDEEMHITINFGSKDNSKRLMTVSVLYPKGTDRPKIYVTKEEVK